MVPSITICHLGPSAVNNCNSITLPPPFLTVGRMFFFEMMYHCTPDIMGPVSSKRIHF
uniref:Uncharacterized protein n=1 Tax=Anguilla anguilla TaxID=7936 RepID=A0A0E9RNE9_ANGAN